LGVRKFQGEKVMKKYLVAAGLIVAFASPALAADYYVALKVGGSGCVIMDHKPGPKYKNMGSFSSRSMAKKAMSEMSDCK
jgi:opacity protein-like surface antigen